MAQTMAVNAIAPFVICSRLKPSMMPPFPFPLTGNNNVKAKMNKSKSNNRENGREETDTSSTSSLPLLDDCYSHIVNVTALEGKFNVGKKSGGHPHTVCETSSFLLLPHFIFCPLVLSHLYYLSILSYLMLSCFISSCLILSCRILSVLSYFILLYLIFSLFLSLSILSHII